MISTNNRPKIMAHVVAAYPDREASLQLARTIVESGADILEVQLPFSEPVADGPTIVAACHASLRGGFRSAQIFAFCRRLHALGAPLIVMSYANPVIKVGIGNFCRRLRAAGVSGLIVPDLPFDSPEGRQLYRSSRKHKLHLVQVVSPAMDRKRLKSILRLSSGMVYCTTKRGTTGGRFRLGADLEALLSGIRRNSSLPVAVGFGISSPGEARAIGRRADIVVIGSAVLRIFQRFRGAVRYRKVSEFIKRLKK